MILPLVLAQLATVPATQPCTSPKLASPEFAGWDSPIPLLAGGPAVLRPGQAVDLMLRKPDDAHFAALPQRAPAVGRFGGTMVLRIARAGTITIALGASVWVDLVGGGKPMPSVTHGHGPECSGIDKFVRFQVTPGDYTIQISGSKADKLRMLVTQSR